MPCEYCEGEIKNDCARGSHHPATGESVVLVVVVTLSSRTDVLCRVGWIVEMIEFSSVCNKP